MIYGFIGGIDEFTKGIRGNGKTSSMTYYLYKGYLANYKILTNYKTTFSKYMSAFEIKDYILDYNVNNIMIGIDEIQLFLNSLGERKKIILEFVHELAAQTRKRNVEFYWSTQSYIDVLKRMRKQTDMILRPIKYDIDTNNICKKDNCKKAHIICVHTYENLTKEILNPTPIDCFLAEEIGKLYNQNEIIRI